MKKLNVMIADDNKDLSGMLELRLNETNCFNVVKVVDNGLEAIEYLNEKDVDILLLDIIMPELDGYDVMNYLNERNAMKPKIICMTQISEDVYVERALNLGASYIMVKPFQADSLIRRMKEFLRIDFTLNEGKFINEASATVSSLNFDYKPRNNTRKAIDERLSNIFISVGIPAHIKGYQFLREAIKLTIDNPDIINSITKKLYPTIAENYETSASKVERAIRHAIEVAWNRGKIENINNVFGIKVYGVNDKPTNGEFIALVADKMMTEGTFR